MSIAVVLQLLLMSSADAPTYSGTSAELSKSTASSELQTLLRVQVRMPWLVPLRVCFFVAYTHFYSLLGQPYPWLQAFAGHTASLAVSWGVDARFR